MGSRREVQSGRYHSRLHRVPIEEVFEKNMALEYSIRILQPGDAKQYSELSLKGGFNCTEGHLKDLIEAYHGYIWGAFLPDGKLVSACVGHPNGDDVGYMGCFVTHPDFRMKGVGQMVWFKCMEALGDRNIFLIAVPNMVPVYMKWGFKTPTTHGFVSIEGIPTLPNVHQPPERLKVQNISESNFDDVMAFDQSLRLVDRRGLMKVLFESEHTKTLKCAVDAANQVVGYIILREGIKGLRMSAFYANTQRFAQALLFEALKDVEPETTIEIGLPLANLEQGKSVYRLFGIEEIVEISDTGLCTKKNFDFPWHKVFGVTEWFCVFY